MVTTRHAAHVLRWWGFERARGMRTWERWSARNAEGELRFRRSGRVSDAYLLVIALRNVLRAARLARKEFVTDAGRVALDQVITAFEETLPGVKSARDVPEHFDGYARGRGGIEERTLGPIRHWATAVASSSSVGGAAHRLSRHPVRTNCPTRWTVHRRARTVHRREQLPATGPWGPRCQTVQPR